MEQKGIPVDDELSGDARRINLPDYVIKNHELINYYLKKVPRVTTITYASWDPGGSPTKRSTGLVLWDENALPVDMMELTQAEFDEKMDGGLPDTIKEFIVEEYKPYGHINHTGSKLLTAQQIGDIKGYARRKGIKVTEVPANCKTIAAAWAQVKLERDKNGKIKHLPDWQAAYLVGYWKLFNDGKIRAKVLDRNKKE